MNMNNKWLISTEIIIHKEFRGIATNSKLIKTFTSNSDNNKMPPESASNLNSLPLKTM